MNSWTRLLTPTELEKTFKPVGNKVPHYKKTVEIRAPNGEIQRFDSAMQAAKNTGINHTTIAKRCRTHHTDKQGNHYRYI